MEGFDPPSELSLRRIAELRRGRLTSASRNPRAIRDRDWIIAGRKFPERFVSRGKIFHM